MIKTIKKYIKKNPLVWRYLLNRQATLGYQVPPLSAPQLKIIDNLREKGIAFCRFEEIITDISFTDFCEAIYNELHNYESSSNIKFEHEQKSYFHFVLGLHPVYDKNSLWNAVATHVKIRQISDAYFRMQGTQMRYYNIWKHQATNDSAKGSQLWHRDREDLKILKIFIYIENVDDRNGPFTYAPSTHLGGKVKKQPTSFKEPQGTERTTDEQMAKVVNKNLWIKGVGKKGTVIFADTHGYHKGGEVREGSRLLFTTMYVSPACQRHYFK